MKYQFLSLFILLLSCFTVQSSRSIHLVYAGGELMTPYPTSHSRTNVTQNSNTSAIPVVIVTTTPGAGSSTAPAVGTSVGLTSAVTPDPTAAVQVNQAELGFRIPTFSDILSFAVRGFFIVAGLAALLFLLLGAFHWITSGGDKEKTASAQKQITAAVLGVILVAAVLAIVVTLEQVVFKRAVCLGWACAITIPSLLKPCGPSTNDPTCGQNGSYSNNSIQSELFTGPTPTVTPVPVQIIQITSTPTPLPTSIPAVPTNPDMHPYNSGQ